MLLSLLECLQSAQDLSVMHRMPILDCGSLGSSLRPLWLPVPSLHSWSSSSPSQAMLGATLLGSPSPWGEALWRKSLLQDCKSALPAEAERETENALLPIAAMSLLRTHASADRWTTAGNCMIMLLRLACCS